jgi:hypothetical protein
VKQRQQRRLAPVHCAFWVGQQVNIDHRQGGVRGQLPQKPLPHIARGDMHGQRPNSDIGHDHATHLGQAAGNAFQPRLQACLGAHGRHAVQRAIRLICLKRNGIFAAQRRQRNILFPKKPVFGSTKKPEIFAKQRLGVQP